MLPVLPPSPPSLSLSLLSFSENSDRLHPISIHLFDSEMVGNRLDSGKQNSRSFDYFPLSKSNRILQPLPVPTDYLPLLFSSEPIFPSEHTFSFQKKEFFLIITLLIHKKPSLYYLAHVLKSTSLALLEIPYLLLHSAADPPPTTSFSVLLQTRCLPPPLAIGCSPPPLVIGCSPPPLATGLRSQPASLATRAV